MKPFAQGELRTTVEMALQRHARERQMREQVAQCRAILDEQVGVILRFQPEGTLIFANRVCGLYFNRRPEDLLGRTFCLSSSPMTALQRVSGWAR